MARPGLNDSVVAAHGSAIRMVSNLALTLPGSIRLEAGQPNFRTPDHIGEAAKRAIDDGWTMYTPTAGLLSLRERLSGKLARVNGITASPEEITVGPGGVGVLAAAFAALVNPGDEVLLPDPHWPNYEVMAAWTRARVVLYPCPPELRFHPDLDRLESLVGPGTKLIVLNSPSNPTGAVFPATTLAAIARIASRHGAWVVSDECYDQVILDGSGRAPSAATSGDPERTISAFTFSKTYAMTGWRLGYATGPGPVVQQMVKVLESQSSCVSTISQKAAEAALDGPQDCVWEMNAAYRRRRDLVCDLLRRAGMHVAEPDGAFYVVADISPSHLDSSELAVRLLRERGVAVAPGSGFGDQTADAVRISLASSDEDLRTGTARLCAFVSELHG